MIKKKYLIIILIVLFLVVLLLILHPNRKSGDKGTLKDIELSKASIISCLNSFFSKQKLNASVFRENRA